MDALVEAGLKLRTKQLEHSYLLQLNPFEQDGFPDKLENYFDKRPRCRADSGYKIC